MPDAGDAEGPACRIRHLDLGSLADADPAAPGQFLVFWLGDWPVGAAFLRGPDDVPAGMTEIAGRCVAPARRAAAGLAIEAAGRPHDGRALSVVICTRDRPEDLARCLACLPRQSRAPDQVVVVDNASRDGARVREVVTAAGADYVREDRPGLDIARNRGVAASRGDIIAFTDDDVRLHPRWLERLAAAFDEEHILAVTGLVLPAELETAAQCHFEAHWSFARGFDRIDFGPDFFASDVAEGCPAWEIGAGASMAFRRQVFDRIGLFDERLDVGAAGCSGDSEFWHRVLTHGGTCRYEPAAVAFHHHRRDFPGLARQIRAYMRGHAAALMVQYERSGNAGNRRRALLTMPAWYAGRLLRRFTQGASERDRLLWQEIGGFASGLLFYWRTPRPEGGSRGG
ncbi:glycosyltransferase family 2 protein [Neoroseomonas soli]|uniref:Glycosyltransferase n=1 Tax=Neoroseomonas soli TaxID=1081025 RepID=A0A9X9WSQ0_9PROT|nr:glycosyltransferase [Neoroseomonas soli]MBR0670179.1 glycosyltransferase [Neoroseomonas soli]